MIEWLKSFFEDNNSGASTTRALNWMWLIFLIFNFTFITITTKKLPVIDSGYIAITTALLATKVGQRIFGETKDV